MAWLAGVLVARAGDACLWDELEADGGVDGNVASDAEAAECCDDQEGGVAVAAAQSEPKGSGDEAGQVKRPSSACGGLVEFGW